MSFPISAALLDAIVLSVVAQEPEGAYGYRITQQVTHTLELSESTLYLLPQRSFGSLHPPVSDRTFNPRSGAATVLPLIHFSERWNDL